MTVAVMTAASVAVTIAIAIAIAASVAGVTRFISGACRAAVVV